MYTNLGIGLSLFLFQKFYSCNGKNQAVNGNIKIDYITTCSSLGNDDKINKNIFLWLKLLLFITQYKQDSVFLKLWLEIKNVC